jgi:cytochrome oxidase Cu insertion factor (SCO1/SenC/PrrC family)
MTMETAETAAANGGRGRGQLVLLLVVFLGPLLVALLAYWQADAWLETAGGGHHGELLDPARPLPGLSLRTLDGQALTRADLRGRWTLLYVGSPACPERCRGALYRMRQAHKAQGRDIGRLQRLLVTAGPLPAGQTRRFLQAEHPHLRVARPAGGEANLAPFRVAGAEGMASPRGIYVVDPNGNLVLRYPGDAGARGLLKDLETLLKHSTIG